MIAVVRRQQLWRPAIESDPIEMTEVWIPALLEADADKVDQAIRFVDAQDLCDVELAAGDRMLQPAGRRVVKIEVSPVLFLREPDHFVRVGEVVPVDVIDPGLEERRYGFFEHGPHG